MTTEISVTTYGCRGSFPVSGEDFNRYGGATSCVVFQIDDLEIILDAGTGIIDYGRNLLCDSIKKGQPVERAIFFSHLHFDHLQGLPFFAPLFHPSTTLHFFGPRPSHLSGLEDALHSLIRSPYFPVELHETRAQKYFGEVSESDVVYFLHDQPTPLLLRPLHPSHQEQIPAPERIRAEVHCLRGYNHPKSGVSIYKIIADGRTFVYATDVEGYVHGDQRLANFARGADLLIHDAMYTDESYIAMPTPTQGYGHSTVEIAAEMARIAEVKKLCLFHHDPKSTDAHLDEVDAIARSLFASSVVARDGLRITI